MMHNRARRRSPVIRIALPWLIDAAATFERLNSIDEKMEKIAIFLEVSAARDTLNSLFIDSIYRPYLRVSLQTANALQMQLQRFLDELSGDWEKEIKPWDIGSIKSAAASFFQILKSELGTLPSFLVLPKGSHDVGVLTEQGEALFPTETASKVPDTLTDMREAGKALAYELPTSCGFHTFRVLEAVLKKYWDHITGGKNLPTPKTIGKIAGELDKGKLGDPRVWETLSQIAKLHRNPIAHPEYILTSEEAIGTIGIAYSAIAAMISVMPDTPPTTTNPSSGP